MSKHVLRDEYIYGPDHAKWSYPSDYLRFSTPYEIREAVSQRALEIFPATTSIWDMFAGVGADTVSLMSKFPEAHVVATEKNPEIYKHLIKNIPESNAICTDCRDALDRLTADLIFFDPPWGDHFRSGVNFEFDQETIDLLSKTIDKLGQVGVIVKCPYMCQTFEREFKDMIKVTIKFPQQKLKFHLLGDLRSPIPLGE